MLGWNILWSDISRPKVCLANWSSTYVLELTNLMNLSFGRKSKLKIHKLCVFIQRRCLLTKEYMQTSEAFFLALFAQQSFSGQKGAWVLCTTKAKDESGCNISDWEIHLKNLVEKYSLTETESKMLSVLVFASVSVSVFAQQKGWVLCCVNGKDENRCKMSYRIRVVGNMKTIRNLIPCCAKTVDAKCQTAMASICLIIRCQIYWQCILIQWNNISTRSGLFIRI